MCRAIKASYSLSFLEVVVCGKVDLVAIDEVEQDGIKGEGKKIIYIHLKKFFRGTRFTSQGFLRCVEKKHIEGDIVCVSGKVRYQLDFQFILYAINKLDISKR